MERAEILQLYNRDVRSAVQAAPGFSIAWDGPVLRMVGPGPEAQANGVLASRLDETSADAAIAREVAFFRRRGSAFEWKLFDYDAPHDLGDRLRVSGFVPEESETLVVREVSDTSAAPSLPAEISIRRLDDPAQFDVIASVNQTVYGRTDHAHWLVNTLVAEKCAAPDTLSVYAAFAKDVPVSVAWLRHRPGDAFGSLWGGATLSEWRGRGIYSALVAARADEARVRGCRWLHVDCSAMSLPILQSRGFTALAVTTPYIWQMPRLSDQGRTGKGG